MIYADHAASSPLRRSALEAMLPFLQQVHANPSSVHSQGRLAFDCLNAARSDIATVLGCGPEEIVFTSGGTESNNLALRGIECDSLILSKIEHHAALEAALHTDKIVDYLAVNHLGVVDTAPLSTITHRKTLCSVMYANNEVGTVQPVAEIAAAVHDRGGLMHCDAIQAPGWLKLDVDSLGIDAMSLSAHKFGGPKGIGCLYLRNGVSATSILGGGVQERQLRPGTQNVAGAVGMAVALQEAEAHRISTVEQMVALRDRFFEIVCGASARIVITGDRHERLANHASFVVDGINGETLLIELDQAGIACSSGSACAAGSPDVSHVLCAMNVDNALARNALRFTFGESTAELDIDLIAKQLLSAIERLTP